ncbi:MAG: hypothetical protein BSOLF_2759 [Candidatus Carbobacillus altaicus]|uniref:Uncharacterized protein n=1 Tax=Candidatus Carbonibacillus altaicus TaxID=2163959 RepID=A0A2R6Y1Z8_9BACL|nr:MAG: hypothetical protein BSOLF_2759 [Candidatus Carbobacillus altaicus]
MAQERRARLSRRFLVKKRAFPALKKLVRENIEMICQHSSPVDRVDHIFLSRRLTEKGNLLLFELK